MAAQFGGDASDGEDYHELARDQAVQLAEAMAHVRRLQAEKDQVERSFEIYREAIAENTSSSSAELKELAAENLALSREAEMLLQENEKVAAELVAVRGRNAELEAVGPEEERAAERGEFRMLAQLRVEKEEALVQLDELRAKQAEAQQQLDASAAEQAAAKSFAVQELVAQNESLGREASMMLEENDRVLLELGTVRGEAAALAQSLQQAQADVDSVRSQLLEARQALAGRPAEEEAQGLREEAAQARELKDGLRAQVAEVERMREMYAHLEVEHGRLTMKSRMDSDRAQAHEELKAQVALLTEERGAWCRQRGALEEELWTLRTKLDALGASQRGSRIEVEELRRLADQHATDRGVLDAEVSRLRAENQVLEAESRELLLRLTDTEARLEVPGLRLDLSASAEAETAPSGSPKTAALAAAEHWVLHEAAAPLDTPIIAYAGATLHIAGLADGPLAAVAAANTGHRARLAAVLESGDAARTALQAYRVHDSERRGALDWPSGQLLDFVDSVFRQHGLAVPDEAVVRDLFEKFSQETHADHLDARSCLCLADALLRGTFFAEGAALSSEFSTATLPTGGAGASEFDDVEARLRARLEQAEVAADRALGRARAAATVVSSAATHAAEGPSLVVQAPARTQPAQVLPSIYAGAPNGCGFGGCAAASGARLPQEPLAREPFAGVPGLAT